MARHKINPFASRDAEIAKLKAELTEFRQHQEMVEFANEVGNNIMTILCSTAYEHWPQVAKMAFEFVAKRAPTTAQLYKNKLPR